MPEATFSQFIRCSFCPENKTASDALLSTAEVYYGKSAEFASGLSSFEGFINKDDTLKASVLHNSEDRKTVLLCYTLLRLIVSKRLDKDPHELSYIYGAHGKPGLKNDPLFFSISHTRNSFSFAISDNFCVGIDVEEFNRDINFESVSRRFFSVNENEFIMNSRGNSRERFFLLWTRKEALLKAIGTGIIPQLANIEVHNPINIIDRHAIDDLKDAVIPDQYYIYSEKLHNNYVSVALPRETKISLSELNEKNLNAYLQ
ncbi:MAG: 4'-phosphopantetheinyl transferase superfamily protein [Bacteroidales bacterium]|nr:4'-phosphopantetheinyl transferase superfamily protein [Bacteroidales bacterium]